MADSVPLGLSTPPEELLAGSVLRRWSSMGPTNVPPRTAHSALDGPPAPAVLADRLVLDGDRPEQLGPGRDVLGRARVVAAEDHGDRLEERLLARRVRDADFLRRDGVARRLGDDAGELAVQRREVVDERPEADRVDGGPEGRPVQQLEEARDLGSLLDVDRQELGDAEPPGDLRHLRERQLLPPTREEADVEPLRE